MRKKLQWRGCGGGRRSSPGELQLPAFWGLDRLFFPCHGEWGGGEGKWSGTGRRTRKKEAKKKDFKMCAKVSPFFGEKKPRSRLGRGTGPPFTTSTGKKKAPFVCAGEGELLLGRDKKGRLGRGNLVSKGGGRQ